MGNKDLIDYEFSMDRIDTFEVSLVMNTTNEIFKSTFKKSAIALSKKKIKEVDPNTDLSFIEEIEVKKSYYPLIKRYMGKIFVDVERDCMRIEKIKFITFEITRILCKKKENGDWGIFVNTKGNFVYL